MSVFPSDARAIFDALGSPDKDLAWIEGDHYLESPADAREDVAALVAGWVAGAPSLTRRRRAQTEGLKPAGRLMDFFSRNSSRPSGPNSRPMPDSL